jgi:hypothetical protein
MLRFVSITKRTSASASTWQYPAPPGLPDPNEEPTPEDAEDCVIANEIVQEMQELGDNTQGKGKRGPYKAYDEEDRLKIARYAVEHGPSAAALHFTAKMGRRINESTVRSIRNQYRGRMQTKLKLRDLTPLPSLPTEKRGRPTLLPEDIDEAVKRRILALRRNGAVVNRSITIGIGRGILAARGSLEQRKSIELERPWATSLMRRMGFVKRKGTKAARKVPDNIEEITAGFHDRITNVTREFNIPRKYHRKLNLFLKT